MIVYRLDLRDLSRQLGVRRSLGIQIEWKPGKNQTRNEQQQEQFLHREEPPSASRSATI
jgi:hypothetical protein